VQHRRFQWQPKSIAAGEFFDFQNGKLAKKYPPLSLHDHPGYLGLLPLVAAITDGSEFF